MILQKMTEEELARIAPLVEPHIPAIETRTGLSRKFIREVLLVSTYFLMWEQGNGFMNLVCSGGKREDGTSGIPTGSRLPYGNTTSPRAVRIILR